MPFFLPLLGLAAVTLLASGCSEYYSKKEENSCDPNQDPECPKPLETVKIPDVYIDGKQIPVKTVDLSGQRKSYYERICAQDEQSVVLKNGVKVIDTQAKVILPSNPLNFPFVSCRTGGLAWPTGRGVLLDPENFNSLPYDSNKLNENLSKKIGVKVATGDIPDTQIDSHTVWTYFVNKKEGVVGLAEIELANQNNDGKILWQGKLSYEGYPTTYPISNGKFILGFLRDNAPDNRRYVSSHYAIFDIASRKFQQFVEAPTEPVFYEPNTPLEKIPYDQLKPYLSFYANRLVVSQDTAWVTHQPYLNTLNLNGFDPKPVDQTGWSTLTKYDLKTGVRTDGKLQSEGVPNGGIYGVHDLAYLPEINQLVLVGGKDPVKGNDDGYVAMFTTPTIYFINPETGKVEKEQTLYPSRRSNGPISIHFSEDGSQIITREIFKDNQGHFKVSYQFHQYQAGSYQLTRKFIVPEIKVGPISYEAKGIDGGLRDHEVRRPSNFEEATNFYNYAFWNRDALLINASAPEPEAIYFQLPSDKKCYEFYDGEGKEKMALSSCLFEMGAIQLVGENVYVGNENQLFKFPNLFQNTPKIRNISAFERGAEAAYIRPNL